jgi:hypothetical protein
MILFVGISELNFNSCRSSELLLSLLTKDLSSVNWLGFLRKLLFLLHFVESSISETIHGFGFQSWVEFDEAFAFLTMSSAF